MGELVGRNVRRERQRHGWTQDDLARHLRDWGLPWPRSAVAKLEQGQRASIDASHLILLAKALRRTPASLLEGDESTTVRLTVDATVSASALQTLLVDGRLPTPDVFDVPWLRRAPEVREEYENERRARERWPDLDDLGHWTAQQAARGDVEAKAAKRLGTAPDEVARAAALLYGRSLTEERDDRLGHPDDGALGRMSARRGHVTRELLREIEPVIEAHKAAPPRSKGRKR